jgi:hypothetical protein
VAADVRAALPGWIVARVLVLVSWLSAHWWVDHHRAGVEPIALTQGLFGWDGVFYRDIAAVGYRAAPFEALRFFPCYPLTGRALDTVLSMSAGTALLIVTNVSALAAGALLHRATKLETGDARAARRAAWYVALVPPAFVLVWGYAEALLLVLAIATFLALRRERWGWAAAFGFLAALTRPTGVFLALAAAVEAGRGIRGRRVRELGPRSLAVVAPVAGTVAYLWWVGHVFGDWHIPIDIQNDLRGGTDNPIVRLGEALSDLGHRNVDGLHFFFGVAFIVLAVVVWRRLPLSYGVYTVAIVGTALAAANLNSIERYGLDAFPLVMALAIATPSRRAAQVTTGVAAVGLTWMCTLAWLGEYVP